MTLAAQIAKILISKTFRIGHALVLRMLSQNKSIAIKTSMRTIMFSLCRPLRVRKRRRETPTAAQQPDDDVHERRKPEHFELSSSQSNKY